MAAYCNILEYCWAGLIGIFNYHFEKYSVIMGSVTYGKGDVLYYRMAARIQLET